MTAGNLHAHYSERLFHIDTAMVQICIEEVQVSMVFYSLLEKYLPAGNNKEDLLQPTGDDAFNLAKVNLVNIPLFVSQRTNTSEKDRCKEEKEKRKNENPIDSCFPISL